MTAVGSPPLTLPLPPEDVEGQAAWYVENVTTIKAIDSMLWVIKRRLMQLVKDEGPIVTEHGRLEIEPDGYVWDADAVAEVMPALIQNARMVVNGPAPEIFRGESLLNEETPSLAVTVTLSVDVTAANRVLREKGEAAAKLEPCRTPKGKLGVTR